MTREEAITYLNVIWNRYKAEYEIERETLDAYHMAIEALQTDFVRCKDCIYYETCNLSSSHWWKGGYTVDIEFCSFGERREA